MDTCLIVEAQKQTNSTLVCRYLFSLISISILLTCLLNIYCDYRVAFYAFLRFVCVSVCVCVCVCGVCVCFIIFIFLINFYGIFVSIEKMEEFTFE